jgi:hypothetical protein
MFSDLHYLGWSVTSRSLMTSRTDASPYIGLPDFYSVMVSPALAHPCAKRCLLPAGLRASLSLWQASKAFKLDRGSIEAGKHHQARRQASGHRASLLNNWPPIFRRCQSLNMRH